MVVWLGHEGRPRRGHCLLPLCIPGIQALLQGKPITSRPCVHSCVFSNTVRKYQNPSMLGLSSGCLCSLDLCKLMQKYSKCHFFFHLHSKMSGRCLSYCWDSYNSYLTINQYVKMSTKRKMVNSLKKYCTSMKKKFSRTAE